MTTIEYERWLRVSFRYGSTERDLYCNRGDVEVFEDILKETEIPLGCSVHLKPMPCVKKGTAFLVDPTTVMRLP